MDNIERPPLVVRCNDVEYMRIEPRPSETEEARGIEVVPLTDHREAVEAERHRNSALVRALAGNSWNPSVEAALYEAARQITASGGSTKPLPEQE